MKRSLHAAVVLACAMLATPASAQRSCSTMEHLAQEIANDPQRAQQLEQLEEFTTHFAQSFDPNGERAVISIPVVFHVVYSTAAQNISDAQILAQIAQLNADYARLNSDAGSTPSAFASLGANTQIQFCLAQRDPNGNATTGIVRKSTTTGSFIDNDNVKFASSGGDNAWPSASYLNIWSCNLGNSLLGYAQFPGGAANTDGVVLLYSSIGSLSVPGTASPYNYGRTATHEVGHWLNLRHIWGDANCGNDQVSDTPTQQTSNFSCPSFPHVTCSNGPNGDMFMNYMDYTDDACMNLFTAGQSTRMNAIFATGGARASLTTSLGCVPPVAGSCNAPSGLAAGGITTSAATLSWSAASGAVSYNVQYKLASASAWTTVNTTSTSYALSGLVSGTGYNAQVQTVCSSGSSAYGTAIAFTTTSTGGGCSDTWESNNTSATAKTIGTNTDITGQIGTSTDIDWYKFTNTSAAPKIKVTLTNLPGDYDLKLYRGTSTLLGTSQNGGTTSEQLISNTTTVSTYYIRVYGYGGAYSATSCYTLRASTQSANWREMEGAAAEVTTSDEELISLYPNPSSDKLNVDYLTDADATLSVEVLDLTGRTVMMTRQAVAKGPNTFGLVLPVTGNGLYILRITNGDHHVQQRFMIQR